MRYGLIGKPLGHSYSKEVHALLADYDYILQELEKDALADFFARRDFAAINVTIPYKEAVIPYLDEISPEAKAIGAVNTVVRRDGRLFGYNTDFFGIRDTLARFGLTDLSGKRALILGSGGTALTARAVLESLGARVLLVSRSPNGENMIPYGQIKNYPDTAILFNATPVGMYPHSEGCPVSLSLFPQLSFVFDAVYNPLRTRLVLDAEARGVPAAGGLYMLVAQAFRAVELFLDKALPLSLLGNAYEKIFRQKQNIVLIGMPSAGKTTVGRILAEKTGRRFVDLDEEIIKRTGQDIPTIFRERGEAGFRDIESAVLRTVCGGAGQVIATGGGAILREDNVTRLKQTGWLLFLDRPLSDLTPTADRPTAKSADAIAALYHERLPRYLAVADRTIPTKETPAQTADAIIKELLL